MSKTKSEWSVEQWLAYGAKIRRTCDTISRVCRSEPRPLCRFQDRMNRAISHLEISLVCLEQVIFHQFGGRSWDTVPRLLQEFPQHWPFEPEIRPVSLAIALSDIGECLAEFATNPRREKDRHLKRLKMAERIIARLVDLGDLSRSRVKRHEFNQNNPDS